VKYTKKRSRKFTHEESRWNKNHSGARSRIETTIGHMKKRFKVLQMPWFKSRESHYEVIKIACALHNYRLAECGRIKL
jgi:hypothetical protein